METNSDDAVKDDGIKEFQLFREEVGRNAKSLGLTEEILHDILTES